MARQKLTDPVTEAQGGAESESPEEKIVTIDELSSADFQPVPVTAARQPHPFEGYPQKKIKIGTYKVKGVEKDLIVNATHIVALNPKEYVHQDPSGKGVSMVVNGQETRVDIPSSHNRIVRNQRGQSEDIVFDREIRLAGGDVMKRVAFCPDHTARSQLIYKVNPKTGKIEVDSRYVLADGGQISRLRKLFEMHHYQQTQSERLSQKFDEEPESRAL